MELNINQDPNQIYSIRFQGAHWAQKFQSLYFTVVGVGGIGSYFAFILARLNPASIFVHDGDVIEEANMSGQFYPREMVGLTKSVATSRNTSRYCAYNHVNAFENFRPSDVTSSITICGLDNMEARTLVFDRWLYSTSSDDKDALFIDGRLALEEMQIFAIKRTDEEAIRKYRERWLFSDSDAEHTICSMKQTTFSACLIGGLMANILVNHVSNMTGESWEREIPFFTYYNTQLMQFKQESYDEQ